MNGPQLMDCCQPSASRLERVNFFNRQLLTAEDMTTDCDYFLQKLRRHNRFMHGWGVVCGLPITAAPIAGAPWRVEVGAGYALGPYGDEIFVSENVYFDLAACLTGGATDPCEPNMVIPGAAGTSTTAYLAIQYAECLARPVQVAFSGCGCDNDPCQYSRVRDSFQIKCLPQLPQQSELPPTLCQIVAGEALAPCPPCPTDPWVVLAKINLPSATTMNITNANIDNVSVRRLILSAAILQDQIVRCCCQQQSSSSSSSSSSASAVDLQSIEVRPQNPNNGPGDGWGKSATLSNPSWDYRLTLTGPAPPQGLLVTITASDNNATPVTPVTVPAGASSHVVSPNTSRGGQFISDTITITATGIHNTAKATLVLEGTA
jgi:hypothetical protein